MFSTNWDQKNSEVEKIADFKKTASTLKMDGKIKYEFSTKMWKHSVSGGWHFVALPKNVSKEIRETLKWQEEGWGRMKANAQIGAIQWETAIWFDTKMDTYLLPIKAKVRTKCRLEVDKEIKMSLWV